MKVWVVTELEWFCYEFEDYTVRGVFSDEKTARGFLAELEEIHPTTQAGYSGGVEFKIFEARIDMPGRTRNAT
jgi:hypothetical protein